MNGHVGMMKLPITSCSQLWPSESSNSSRGGMFRLNAKFDADLLLYLLSHFECNSYTVHMLTQWRLSPPLTSTVKSSLFTHAHSSPLSLAARLLQCHTNHPCYINNGWTFTRQILYFGNKFFIIHVICKYFLPACGLSFILLTVFFKEQMFQFLMKSNSSICSLMNHAFDVVSEQSLPNSRS